MRSFSLLVLAASAACFQPDAVPVAGSTGETDMGPSTTASTDSNPASDDDTTATTDSPVADSSSSDPSTTDPGETAGPQCSAGVFGRSNFDDACFQ